MEPRNIIKNCSNSKVLFITGSSSGIGLAITKYFLEHGYRVAATSRSKVNLLKVVDCYDESKFLPLENDLLKDEAIRSTIDQVMTKFGRIDIVVNNAGYGCHGSMEAHTDQDLRNLFDINFFSYASVMRHVTKYLQPGSHVFNVSSICGMFALSLLSSYVASKFAIDGLTESYAKEVTQLLGIKVTILNLGSFASSFMNVMKLPSTDLKEKYQSLEGKATDEFGGLLYRDPVKIAEIIDEVIHRDGPAPLHLFVGPDSDHLVKQKLKELEKDVEDNQDLTVHKFMAKSA